MLECAVVGCSRESRNRFVIYRGYSLCSDCFMMAIEFADKNLNPDHDGGEDPLWFQALEQFHTDEIERLYDEGQRSVSVQG